MKKLLTLLLNLRCFLCKNFVILNPSFLATLCQFLIMEGIQVGGKVRILANDNVKGWKYEPETFGNDSSKHLKPLKAELKDKLGIVIPTPGVLTLGMGAIKDDEVFVKLDNGWTVIISKSHLTVIRAKKTQ